MQKRHLVGLLLLLASLLTSASVRADWRGEIGVFRIGLVTESQSPEYADRLEPFRAAISEALDIEVEFFRGRNPQALIDALATDRIEYAVLSSFSYALASNACACIEPLVTPRAIDSTDGYHLVLIARNGGPASMSDLTGTKVAMLAGENTAENFIVRGAISEAGVNLDSIDFTSRNSGEKTLEAFAAGEFDVLAGWSSMTGIPSDGYSRGTLRLLAEKQLGDPRDYSVIWQSAMIPHRVHVVGKKLPGEAKTTLRNLLNNMHDRNPAAYDAIEPVYGGGFVASRHSRFQPLLGVVEAIDAVEQAKQVNKQPGEESKNPPQD